MVARLWGPERIAVLVTCGAEGVWNRSRGAYAVALARGFDIAGCIRVAAAAAIKATRPGGQAGIPDWPGITAFLAQHAERIGTLTAVAAPQTQDR